jgi:hypothetical protein
MPIVFWIISPVGLLVAFPVWKVHASVNQTGFFFLKMRLPSTRRYEDDYHRWRAHPRPPRPLPSPGKRITSPTTCSQLRKRYRVLKRGRCLVKWDGYTALVIRESTKKALCCEQACASRLPPYATSAPQGHVRSHPINALKLRPPLVIRWLDRYILLDGVTRTLCLSNVLYCVQMRSTYPLIHRDRHPPHEARPRRIAGPTPTTPLWAPALDFSYMHFACHDSPE